VKVYNRTLSNESGNAQTEMISAVIRVASVSKGLASRPARSQKVLYFVRNGAKSLGYVVMRYRRRCCLSMMSGSTELERTIEGAKAAVDWWTRGSTSQTTIWCSTLVADKRLLESPPTTSNSLHTRCVYYTQRICNVSQCSAW
jgi:hypothetical protein